MVETLSITVLTALGGYEFRVFLIPQNVVDMVDYHLVVLVHGYVDTLLL